MLQSGYSVSEITEIFGAKRGFKFDHFNCFFSDEEILFKTENCKSHQQLSMFLK